MKLSLFFSIFQNLKYFVKLIEKTRKTETSVILLLIRMIIGGGTYG